MHGSRWVVPSPFGPQFIETLPHPASHGSCAILEPSHRFHRAGAELRIRPDERQEAAGQIRWPKHQDRGLEPAPGPLEGEFITCPNHWTYFGK